MLDYVKRAELDAERALLDAERALRIRAESEVAFLRAENTRLLTALDNQRAELNSAHAEQVQKILDHVAPLQQTFDTGAVTSNGQKSPLELLAEAYSEPAIGPAAIEAKRNKIAKLEKAVGDSAMRVPADDNGDLSAEEEARIAAKLESSE